MHEILQVTSTSRDPWGRIKSYLEDPRLQLLGLVFLSLLVNLIGIRKNLPYTWELDEDTFANSAIKMASTGDLNPGFFGHPGSTTIYPLFLLYHLQYWLQNSNLLFRPDLGIQTAFQENPEDYYITGRLLCVLYATLTIPVIFFIGSRVFGKSVGFLAAFFVTAQA